MWASLVANFLALWVWGRYFGIDIRNDMSKILVELNCLLTLTKYRSRALKSRSWLRAALGIFRLL